MTDPLRDATACDNCGCEERDQRGILTCRCPDTPGGPLRDATVAEVERLQGEQSPPVMYAALLTKLKEEWCEAQHARAEQAEAERNDYRQRLDLQTRDCLAAVETARAVTAERDDFTRMWQQAEQVAAERAAERDRLKAALEEAIELLDLVDCYSHEHLRKALVRQPEDDVQS